MANNYTPPSRSQRKTKLMEFGCHIFYCEGVKTEPQYIENMKKVIATRYKMAASDIIIVDKNSGGRSTLGLVEYAEEDIAQRKKNDENIDHVWIFYDRDSFKKDAYDNTYNKIVSKNKLEHKNDEDDYCDVNGTRWHALWSNECFELWVLLHFQYNNAALSRDSYIPKINKYLPFPYKKNSDHLYQILEKHGDIKNAVRWAKKLNDNLDNPNDKDNPSTGVYEMIEYFKLYLRLDF